MGAKRRARPPDGRRADSMGLRPSRKSPPSVGGDAERAQVIQDCADTLVQWTRGRAQDVKVLARARDECVLAEGRPEVMVELRPSERKRKAREKREASRAARNARLAAELAAIGADMPAALQLWKWLETVAWTAALSRDPGTMSPGWGRTTPAEGIPTRGPMGTSRRAPVWVPFPTRPAPTVEAARASGALRDADYNEHLVRELEAVTWRWARQAALALKGAGIPVHVGIAEAQARARVALARRDQECRDHQKDVRTLTDDRESDRKRRGELVRAAKSLCERAGVRHRR
jgi:hypothetical protein